MGITEDVAYLIVQQVEKEKYEWTSEKVKKLKQYIRKKFSPGDIAKMLDMTEEVVKAKVDSIQNSQKTPIVGSSRYEAETDSKHKTFIPPFVKAIISIDSDDKPIK